MKVFRIIIAFIFLYSFFVIFTSSADASCYSVAVSVTGSNIPAGTSISVSCTGDNPPGPSNCIGDSASVAVGSSYTLSRCSCYANNCISISGAPPGCVMNTSGEYCATNGQSIATIVDLQCQAPCTAQQIGGCGGCSSCGSPGQCVINQQADCSQTCDFQSSCPGPTPTTVPTPTSGPTPTPVPLPILGLTIKHNTNDSPAGVAGPQYGISSLRTDDPSMINPGSHGSNYYNSLALIPKVTNASSTPGPGEISNSAIQLIGIAYTNKASPPSTTTTTLSQLVASANANSSSYGFVIVYAHCGNAAECNVGGKDYTNGNSYVQYGGQWYNDILEGKFINIPPTGSRAIRFESAPNQLPQRPSFYIRLYNPFKNQTWGTYTYLAYTDSSGAIIETYAPLTPSATYLPLASLFYNSFEY